MLTGRDAWWLGGLVLVALMVRLPYAQRALLWADEYFSLAHATGHSLEHPAEEAGSHRLDFIAAEDPRTASDYAELLRHPEPPARLSDVTQAAMRSDTNPPLYLWMLSWWSRAFGTSDLALRVFSLLGHAIALPFVFALGRQLGGNAAGWYAAVLFSATPLSLFYAVEGRMYSWLWVWSASSLWLAAREPRRLNEWTMWAMCCLAGLWTHYFFLFVWSAQLLFLGWRHRSTHRGFLRSPLLVATAAVVLGCLPWYVHVPSGFGGWRVTAGWLDGELSAPERLLGMARLAHAWVATNGDWGGTWALRWVQGCVLVVVAATLLRHGRAILQGPRGLAVSTCLAAVLGPLVMDLALGTITVTIPRYGLAGLPVACALLGFSLASLARVGPVALAVLLVGWGSTWHLLWQEPDWHREPYAQIGTWIEHQAERNELVIVQSIPSGVAGLARSLPPGQCMIDWVEPLGGRDVARDLPQWVRPGSRVFLVEIHALGASASVRDWLDAHGRRMSERTFADAGAWIYSLP